MPGYGVKPVGEGKLLPWSWAVERIDRSRNFWVATVRPDGRPHCMAVWGIWLEGAFRFSTSVTSRKAQNLAASPECVITTELADEPVVIEGRAELVEGDADFERFCDAYQEKYDFRPTRELGPVFAVRPRKALGFIEAADEFADSATRWHFPSA